jgi:ribosome modulation factor
MNEAPQLPKGVFSEGEDSYSFGLPREDCPYPPDSDEREAWLEGWDHSARQDGVVKGSDAKGT